MAPLGPQLWPGICAHRVMEDDLRSHQGVSGTSVGTNEAAVWSDRSLQGCYRPLAILRAPLLVRQAVYLPLDRIHLWSDLTRKNP
jgi:hypothetical protein